MSVLAVTHIKGGVGKTTTAVNLAFLAAREGPSLLWDLDPQGAASYTLRVRPRTPVGAARLLKDEDALQEAIKATDHPGLDLLPADFSLRKLDALLARRDGRGHGLTRTLAPLRLQYRHVLLDCPPGISFLAENVFDASDALILPTPAVPLALRTLARLCRHVARRRGSAPRLMPFLSLLDRRKAVQAAVAEWADSRPDLVLPTCVPYAALVEQMSVRRAPLGAFASGSQPALAVEALWDEIRRRLDQPAIDGLLLAEAVDALLARLQAVDAPLALSAEGPDAPQPAPQAAPPASSAVDREVEFKLVLRDDADVSALLAALPADGPPPGPASEQLNHYFDTAGGALRRARLLLRLREEGCRFTLTAKGPAAEGADPALADRAEVEASLDAAWSFDLLGEQRSPLEVLAARLQPRRPPLLDDLARAAGARPLRRVATLRNLRRRVGPLALPGRDGPVKLTLELDTSEFPGGRIEREVEAEVPGAQAAAAQDALGALFARAGLPWQTAPSKAERLFSSLRRAAR